MKELLAESEYFRNKVQKLEEEIMARDSRNAALSSDLERVRKANKLITDEMKRNADNVNATIDPDVLDQMERLQSRSNKQQQKHERTPKIEGTKSMLP